MIKEPEIREGLLDAGCADADVRSICDCFSRNDMASGMKTLEKCRKELLRNLHEEQLKIDRLDYIAYQMRDRQPGD